MPDNLQSKSNNTLSERGFRYINVRSFLRDINESTEELPVIVTRYGKPIFAVVSWDNFVEDYMLPETRVHKGKLEEPNRHVKEPIAVLEEKIGEALRKGKVSDAHGVDKDFEEKRDDL